MKVVRLAALTSAAIFALAAAPAFAQSGGGDGPHINLVPELTSRTPEQKEEDAVRDRAYRESLRKIPDTKASSDPWGTVRAADAPKPTAPAPVKPRTKTGSTAN